MVISIHDNLITSPSRRLLYALLLFALFLLTGLFAIKATGKDRHWWQGLGMSMEHNAKLLLDNTRKLMPPNTPNFHQQALAALVLGMPEELLAYWQPDHLNLWIHQACERWCAANPCEVQTIPDIFLHYVLAPVTTHPEQLQQEITLRLAEYSITEQPITTDSADVISPQDPWLQAVLLRRQGLPAAVDFNPVTRQQWLVELNSHGQLTHIMAAPDAQHIPIKVMRYSFLNSAATLPHHQRYRGLFHQGAVVDVTNQYNALLIPYPRGRFRYGLYTCATVDGDQWWALDIADSEPGLHGLPALIGFAHEVKQGRCLIPSMDRWLMVLREDGQALTLNPIEPDQLSVELDLADLMRGVDHRYLTGDQCKLQRWHNRYWQRVPTTLANEPDVATGTLQTELSRFVLYRLRCEAQTVLFTVDDNMLELWSWPAFSSGKTLPFQEHHS